MKKRKKSKCKWKTGRRKTEKRESERAMQKEGKRELHSYSS